MKSFYGIAGLLAFSAFSGTDANKFGLRAAAADVLNSLRMPRGFDISPARVVQ